jgi:ABC-2 type transport system permease protein
VVSDEIAVGRVSYFDMVLLGLVGLGIMTNSIISIAVKISTYRDQAILKRMLVTPLAIWKYFAAEITAHLMLALVQAAIILAVGVLVFGAQMPGNLLGVLVVVLLGSLVFLNIGFILSAWANTPSAASGMGNVIALPMIFLAGTFFSTASLPWLLPYLAQALPLTPMLSALREVAIDNAPLWAVWPQLAALMGWVLITSLAAIKVFRFS